jgi:hypothetical protein
MFAIRKRSNEPTTEGETAGEQTLMAIKIPVLQYEPKEFSV